MFRTLMVIAAVGALSCHRPTAQAESPDPTTGASEPAGGVTLDVTPVRASTAASAARVAAEAPEPAQSAQPAEAALAKDEPPTISLCCDEFAGGLCFLAAPDQCQAETSKPRECPAASVREIHDRDGRSAWVCAEP
jgi:hypothetical protein